MDVLIIKVNIEEFPTLAEKFNIKALPTVLFFKDGVITQRIKGFTAKQWAVADSMLLKEYAKMVEITAPMVIPNKPDNPLIQEYVGYMDYIIGLSDPRCIYGHNPA